MARVYIAALEVIPKDGSDSSVVIFECNAKSETTARNKIVQTGLGLWPEDSLCIKAISRLGKGGSPVTPGILSYVGSSDKVYICPKNPGKPGKIDVRKPDGKMLSVVTQQQDIKNTTDIEKGGAKEAKTKQKPAYRSLSNNYSVVATPLPEEVIKVISEKDTLVKYAA